ncbi:MAG TPA: hypothetical protein PLL30_03805 [Candidatus Krumholzibacteria bacterium]|nr:hypothetical protein [Candidatus Krumholzibacteria bacterium]HPD70899.1 hypothetical protein [Candidatus Krumholzibacteria bacterium]HRY39401.1 hypothetical protein [Candidatus Krumholzibacteria bacterium]
MNCASSAPCGSGNSGVTALSDASLTELVAELRERLRHFDAGPPGAVATPASGPGPLGPAGRSALAARLLSVVLGAREEPASGATATAFAMLAAALAASPPPLPGSALETELGLLASEFESLTAKWDRGEERALGDAWEAVRRAGDRLWPPDRSATPAVGPSRVVWLLTAGSLRRRLLERRLRAAGLQVECHADVDSALARLDQRPPAALICDDAAPMRHCSRLRRRLPPSAPPVIQVSSSLGAQRGGPAIWTPPYRAEDLLRLLGD